MNILEKLSSKLSGNIELTNTQADGRLNSAIDEDAILLRVKDICEKDLDGCEFIEAPARYWYDFAIKTKEGDFFPVNVKISGCNSADNVSSKLGMFYALTGKNPSSVKGLNQWEGFMSALFKNLNYSDECTSDYYFLIVNKNDCSVHTTSLLKINKLTPNGNNLPFQAKWKDNFEKSNKTRQEAIDYVLKIFYESWEKKCSAFATLQKLMNSKNFD